MAVLEGGIFSKPRGKTGGLVFGAARTRTGKKVTARQLVPPSNPNTAAQQIQRNKFSAAQDIVRGIGTSIYQGDFNRAISQLPGYQSMMSIYINSLNDALVVTAIPDINLGTLHLPDSVSLAAGAAGEIVITYSTENGSNGTSADLVVAFAVPIVDADRATDQPVISIGAATRTDGTLTLTGLKASTAYSVGFYLRGQGTALNLLSVCRYNIDTSG